MSATGAFMSSVMQAAASGDPASPPGVAPQAASQAPPAPSPVQQSQTLHQQIPASQQDAQGSSEAPRPVGWKAEQSAEASPKEQAEYAQLVLRFQNYISDTKAHDPQQGSTSAAVMKQLNDNAKNVPQAVGDATAQAIYILWRAAKSQKVDYSPDVMFHAADECNALMYLKGQAAGIFKGTPPFNVEWMKRNMHGHEPYPFTPLEIHIIASAKIYAVQHFGKLEQKMGDISMQTRQQALAFWKEQVQKEISEGKVSDATLQKLMESHGFAAQLAQGTASPAPQPAPPQPQPQQAPPQQPPPAQAPSPQGGQP